MKKELMNTFFLAFAAFFISTTINSVASNGKQKSYKEEVACQDSLGVEKFNWAKTAEAEAIPLNVKIEPCEKSNKAYVKNDDFKYDRFPSLINRTY